MVAELTAAVSDVVATETVVLPRERFRELVATEPAIRDALLASLAGELRRLTTHVEELLTEVVDAHGQWVPPEEWACHLA